MDKHWLMENAKVISITYEKANQLMEAVKYCIDELYEGNDKCELNLAQGKI